LPQTLKALKPLDGFCIMADIVRSTELKDRDTIQWVTRLANTFNHVRGWVSYQFLKTVGDMLMVSSYK